MSYLRYLGRLFRFDFSVFSPGGLPARPFLFSFINVFIVGLLYGSFSLLYNQQQLSVFTDSFSKNLTAGLIVLSGALVALIVHAGASLFIWTFCRGVGGNTGLIYYYVATGLAVPLLWLAMPFLSAYNAGLTSYFILIAIAFPLAAFLASMAASLKEASGLSVPRLVAGLSLTVVVVGSFLYLWL
ncbi:MAG TPA: hypothetical protein DEF34_11690 [Desulfotomaculum sp.]|nr:MAG: hypothetical protein VR67_00855 [Peptococcaceae bacterium BRH_c8a]KJS77787.1 MAG: hypothetical protein JL56_02310 [Desulfotomaculum sp. BICA1-6]KJS77849.1 MAG: hypothetical protein JL56_02150 [Desulfotomaculum sp. BICA1-6]HBX24274.1 hypothetical protein [Desulfotomaculum sp.]